MPIYYINLNKNIDRNYRIKNQLSNYNIRATRISAVYGKKFHSNKEGVFGAYKFKNTFNITNSELGCSLSHLLAIKNSYENGDYISVIIEDDTSLDLMPFWEKDLLDILNDIDYDIIQLSNSSCEINNKVEKYNYKCYGTFAYAIKRTGMKNILDKFYKNGIFILESKVNNNDKNIVDGRADVLLYKYAGKAMMISYPLFFTMNVVSTIRDKTANDIMATKKSTNSIKFYTDKYPDINQLSPDMFISNNNKPIIWQIWINDNILPSYLQLCHETVKKFNAEYFTVVLITNKNINEYVKNLHTSYNDLSYTHKTDYLKCILLNTYGGIYIDIDTVCFKCLDTYFKNIVRNDAVGYRGDTNEDFWGLKMLGPYRPNSLYTTSWKKNLDTILDIIYVQMWRYVQM